MTPEQALENLNQATGQLQLTRQQHLILAKSVEVLRETLEHYIPINHKADLDPRVECGMKSPGAEV